MKQPSRPIRVHSTQHYAKYRLPDEVNKGMRAELPPSRLARAARIDEIVSWGLVPTDIRFPPLAY